METKNSSDSVANHHNGVVRWLREVPPAHYILKIESLSLFLNSETEIYQSQAFEAGGYKWKLTLYPNGNKKRNVNGHSSLYLTLADTETLPVGWEVNTSFKLLVFDHIRDKYLTVQLDVEGGIRRFHRITTEWGFDNFLPIQTFKDASNGYLLGDCCLFGAEVFVIKHNGKGECLSMIKNPRNNTFTWKIEQFSAVVDKEVICSDEFVIGDHKWKLSFYPKGCGAGKGDYVSIFMWLANWNDLASEQEVYAEYKLRIWQQLSGKHVEGKAKHWFGALSRNWGYSKFLSLSTLNKASQGYKVNDKVVVEAEISLISSFRDF